MNSSMILRTEDRQKVEKLRQNFTGHPAEWSKYVKLRSAPIGATGLKFDEDMPLSDASDFDLLVMQNRPVQPIGLHPIAFLFIAISCLLLFIIFQDVLVLFILPPLLYVPAKLVSKKLNEADQAKFAKKYPPAQGAL